MADKLYPFRNLPCDCAEVPWYIAGREIDDHGCVIGGGVLEWCTDEQDAIHRFAIMQEYPHQFTDLKMGEWEQK